MKRARIKARANVSLGRKVSKAVPNVCLTQNEDKVKATTENTDSYLVTNVTLNDKMEIQNASNINIKLEAEALHIYHATLPVMIDKDSCQNESVLPTTENIEEVTVNQTLIANLEPDVIIQTGQVESGHLLNENRVTIYDVIHTRQCNKKIDKESPCVYCNKLNCSNHNMCQNMNVNTFNETQIKMVKVGLDGNLVIDDDVQKNDKTQAFFDKYRHKKKFVKEWTTEENVKFYKALKVFGTDFTLMQSWFPNKTRNELKCKFKKEEKCNINILDNTLKNQLFSGAVIQKGIGIFKEEENEMANYKVLKKSRSIEKKSKKKRKCRFVVNSIELSSTDGEESNEENNANEKKEQQVSNVKNKFQKLRYEEINNIVKNIENKHAEKANLREST